VASTSGHIEQSLFTIVRGISRNITAVPYAERGKKRTMTAKGKSEQPLMYASGRRATRNDETNGFLERTVAAMHGPASTCPRCAARIVSHVSVSIKCLNIEVHPSSIRPGVVAAQRSLPDFHSD
jgi:hypothetical protein